MSEDFVEYEDEIPVLGAIQVVGGGVTIGPNINLETDEDLVTFEAVAMIPTEEGPQLGMLPILMSTDTWDMLRTTTKYITKEQA